MKKNIKLIFITLVFSISSSFTALAEPTMGVVVKIGGIPWFNAMEDGIKNKEKHLG